MKHFKSIFVSGCQISAALAVFVARSAAAQQAPPTAAPTSSETEVTGLNDIVVTAQKRPERLQDVPIAVAVLTANELQQAGVTSTENLAMAVPGLVFTTSGNAGNPYIRGVGTNQIEPNSEQSVSIYVDGVYIANPLANVFALNNVSQIEVLKGPQGTLFGRNATGGVISIVTRTPSHTTGAAVSVGYASYDDVTASIYATGGLSSNLAADVAVTYENQGKGWGRNFFTGAKTFQQAVGNFAVRSKLLFTPSPTTTITLAADYAHSVNTDAYQKPQGECSLFDPTTCYNGPYNTNSDYNQRTEVNTGGASLQIKQDFHDFSVTSITSYRKTKAYFNLDEDFTPLPIADVTDYEPFYNWSQELQINSDANKNFRWLVGGYSFFSRGGNDPISINGAPLLTSFQNTNSLAVFAQSTLRVLKNTSLTTGIRYTTEKQRADFPQIPPLDGIRQSFNKITYRVALDHHFGEHIMGYLSYNVGFKSGGFNLVAPGNSFQPETLKATEVGLKTELFGRHLRLNIAAFSYDYQNLQEAIPTRAGLIIVNAASASSKGIDADFTALLPGAMIVSGGVSYLHARYNDFPNAPVFTAGGTPIPNQNVRGLQTPYSPELSATGQVERPFITSFGEIRPGLTITYSSGYPYTPDNRLRQRAYALLGGSVTWTLQDKKISLRVWGKNITDTRYIGVQNEFAGLGDAQAFGAPRTVGATLSRTF